MKRRGSALSLPPSLFSTMKLEPQQHDKSPREEYNPANWPVDWHSKIKRMFDLVVYLEDEVVFPPVEASYSHENLVLTSTDRSWTLWISPSVPLGAPVNAIYMLGCPLGKPWHHALAYAADLEEVGRIIAAVVNSEIKIAADYTRHRS